MVDNYREQKRGCFCRLCCRGEIALCPLLPHRSRCCNRSAKSKWSQLFFIFKSFKMLRVYAIIIDSSKKTKHNAVAIIKGCYYYRQFQLAIQSVSATKEVRQCCQIIEISVQHDALFQIHRLYLGVPPKNIKFEFKLFQSSRPIVSSWCT